jgi:transposase
MLQAACIDNTLPHVALAPLSQTEDEAREALLALCWPDGTKRCPRCGTGGPYQLAGGRLRCGNCRYTFHDFTGRWLNETGLSPLKWLRLAQAFAAELSTREAAAQVGISYNTAFKALTVLRLAILAQGADARQLMGPGAPLFPILQGARVEEAHPHGTTLPVYGLLSRSQHIFVDLLPEITAESVLHFNHNFHLRVVRHGSILITDRYKTYDALILCGDESLPYHYLLRHPGQIFAESGAYSFWDYTQPRLRQFKGLSWRRFPLYLKELAMRYNMRQKDFTPSLLAALCSFVPKFA